MIARLASVSLVFFVTFGVLIGGRAAHADSDPRAVIEKFCDQLLDVMKHGQALGFAGRAQKLQPAIAAAYDMPAMMRSTLGAAGSKLSPDDAQKISEAYSRLSVATYAQNFPAGTANASKSMRLGLRPMDRCWCRPGLSRATANRWRSTI